MYLNLACRSGIGQILNKLKVAPKTIERESGEFDQQPCFFLMADLIVQYPPAEEPLCFALIAFITLACERS